MNLPKLCVEHSGADPVWHGNPEAFQIQRIQALTHTAADGKRYWRRDIDQGWRALRSPIDFDDLNKAL